MTPFVPCAQGYVAQLEPAEREVLAGLARDVAAMVRAEVDPAQVAGWAPEGWVHAAGTGGDSPDPAVRRLLPVASADEAVAEEFRRLASGDIAQRKVAGLLGLATLVEAAPRVVVSRTDADGVAGALTDVRLVLAERLHLGTDAEVEALYDELTSPPRADRRGDADARRHLIAVFLLAGLLQESLVEGMLADLRGGRTE